MIKGEKAHILKMQLENIHDASDSCMRKKNDEIKLWKLICHWNCKEAAGELLKLERSCWRTVFLGVIFSLIFALSNPLFTSDKIYTNWNWN